MAINPSIVTRDLDKVADKTGNIYESLHIVGSVQSRFPLT
jgi:hypothetical protein